MTDARRNSDESRRRILAGLAVAALIAIAVVFWPRPRAEVALAERAADAYLAGDLWRLYELASPREREVLGLTRSQVKRIEEELYLPRWRRFQVKERREATYTVATGEAAVPILLESADGASYPHSWVASTDGDGAVTRFSTVFVTMWHLDGLIEEPQTRSARDGIRFLIDGCRRDRALLEEIGVRGLVTSKGELASWDEQITYWEEVRAKLGSSPSSP